MDVYCTLPFQIIRIYLQNQTLEHFKSHFNFHYNFTACGPLSNPENGEVNVAGYTEGSFVTYTCDATYSQLSGSTKRTCTNGEWTGMPVVCSKVGMLCNVLAIATPSCTHLHI